MGDSERIIELKSGVPVLGRIPQFENIDKRTIEAFAKDWSAELKEKLAL